MEKTKTQLLHEHSIRGYIKRLTTSELIHLLDSCIANEQSASIYAKEIMDILENLSGKNENETADLLRLKQQYQQKTY